MRETMWSRLARAVSRVLPLLALAAFWLPVLGPLTHPGRMTNGHDSALYYQRVFQLDAMLQQGGLWPRWLPNMVFGYGYPLFNFHPVLGLYPAVILHRAGLTLLQSWNLSLGLSVLASGLAMYLWARLVFGSRGGFVAAVAYMLAPYQLYDVYWRGNIAESLAFPWLPVAMWAVLRTSQERRWRYVAAAALAYAVILLTHSAVALIFTPVMIAYMVALVLETANRRAVASRLIVVLLLGLGLATFFLAPAYLEKDQVQLWRAIAPGLSDFRNHFLTLAELFGPASTSDPSLVNPSVPRSLGCITCVLAAVGILATWLRRRRVSRVHSLHLLWAGVTLIGAVIMTLPISEPVWSHISLLAFLQYPMRFLSVGCLLVGLLAGASVAVLDSRGWGQAAAMMFSLVLLVVGALPWLYPTFMRMPANLDQAYYANYEQGSKTIGTTVFAEYLPVAVQEYPTSSPMVGFMRDGQPVNRWDVPGARVVASRDDGLSAQIVFESDEPIQVTYQEFYFPGWQAHLDGQSVPLSVTSPLGLMALTAPAGRHTLELRFSDTPLRTVSMLVSLMAVALVVAIGWLDFRLRDAWAQMTVASVQPVRPVTWLGLAALGITLFVLKFSVVDRYDTLLRWRRLQNGQLTSAPYASDIVVAGRTRLLGYDIQPSVAPGDVFYVDMYWAAPTQPLYFGTSVRLLDEDGSEWSPQNESDVIISGYNRPPSSLEWSPGMYADDRHAVQVQPGTPPGVYSVVVVPFDPDSLGPLPISAGRPAPNGYPGAVVGTLQVMSSPHPPAIDSLGLAVRVDVPMNNDLSLIGYGASRPEVAPGEEMLLALGWQAHQHPQTDYALRLELIAPDQQSVMQVTLPPSKMYPTSRWTDGEVLLSQIWVHIPRRAQSGVHRWRLTLLDGNGAQMGQTIVGSVQVIAPQHVLTAPAVSHPSNLPLGDWVVLTGFDVPARLPVGQSMTVTLVWQAVGETDQDYKAFVHLFAPDGQLVAQSDAVPANWTRPTSGWQSGEYIVDAHTLDLGSDLPAGEYRLAAGMYDSANGQRLPAPGGTDRIDLGVVQLSK